MAVTFVLASNPLWYFVDMTGKPLVGGYVAFYSTQNPTQQKLVYQDSGGVDAWPTEPIPNTNLQGVLIDGQGQQGPFFFAVDSAAPTNGNGYEIYIFDMNGVQQHVPIHNFTPPSGGGGSVVTEIFEINNLINNGVFYRNAGTITGVPAFQKLAPSNHAGLAATTSNAGPDIIFFKGNTSATDSISFPAFAPGDLGTDITPTNYFHYVCSVPGSSEGSKVVQFPINAKLINFSNEAVIGTIWARSSSSSTITVQGRQFYGDGAGAHADVTSFPTAIALTPNWAQYPFSGSFGNIGGNTIGKCYNDGTFLQIELPVNTNCTIDLVKPDLYLGITATPPQDFQTYDDIESLVSCPRTGDIRTSMNAHYFWGWVPMNDGTIGDDLSNASTLANQETFPLFNEIWTRMQSNQQYAPMFNSSGVQQAYGASAIADYTAHNQLALTKALGQVFAGVAPLIAAAQTYTTNHAVSNTNLTLSSGTVTHFPLGTPVVLSGGTPPTGLTNGTVYYSITSAALGATVLQLASTLANALAGTAVTFSADGSGTTQVQAFSNIIGSYRGEEGHVMAVAELPTPVLTPGIRISTTIGADSTILGGTLGKGNPATLQPVITNVVEDTGTGAPLNVVQPTTYLNVYIKL